VDEDHWWSGAFAYREESAARNIDEALHGSESTEPAEPGWTGAGARRWRR
jgi:hypothetical protein